MRLFKLKNRGFTLIELIIVVAIMGVVALAFGLSVNTIPAARARQCAKELDSMLSRAKVEAMTRGGIVTLKVFSQDGKVVAVIAETVGADENQLDREVLSSSGVSVSPLPLEVTIERGTGAFVFSGEPVKRVSVSGGGAELAVILFPATGGHYLEGEYETK